MTIPQDSVSQLVISLLEKKIGLGSWLFLLRKGCPLIWFFVTVEKSNGREEYIFPVFLWCAFIYIILPYEIQNHKKCWCPLSSSDLVFMSLSPKKLQTLPSLLSAQLTIGPSKSVHQLIKKRKDKQDCYFWWQSAAGLAYVGRESFSLK